MTSDTHEVLIPSTHDGAGSDAPKNWKSGIDLSSWRITADESISQFLGCVARNVGSSQWNIGHHSSNGYTFVLLKLSEHADEVMLQIRYNHRSSKFVADLIGSCRPSEKRALIKKWRTAVESALQEVYTPQSSRWRAKLVIGESTQLSKGPDKLSGSGSIGPFDIVPSSGPIWVRSESPSVEGYSIQTVWPINVWGESPLDQRQMPVVPQNLRDLCLILAIATGHHWSIRGQLVPESRVPTPQRELAQQQENWDEFGTPELDHSPRGEFSIEPWMTSGFILLDKEPLLRNAAGMFDQGLIIGIEHPSVAALCFISAIEAIGELAGDELPTCQECGSKIGVTKRFEDQIAKVVPEEKRKYYKDLYEKRSTTVHVSQLHGDEFKSTPFDMSFNPFSKNANFIGSVFALRETSRAILRHTLEALSQTEV